MGCHLSTTCWCDLGIPWENLTCTNVIQLFPCFQDGVGWYLARNRIATSCHDGSMGMVHLPTFSCFLWVYRYTIHWSYGVTNSLRSRLLVHDHNISTIASKRLLIWPTSTCVITSATRCNLDCVFLGGYKVLLYIILLEGICSWKILEGPSSFSYMANQPNPPLPKRTSMANP